MTTKVELAIPRRITEVNLVAYLLAKNYRQSSPPRLISNTVNFFFPNSAEIIGEIDAFFGRRALVEPLAMAEALRVLRALIADLRRNPVRTLEDVTGVSHE